MLCLSDVDRRYWAEKKDVCGLQAPLQTLGRGRQEQEVVPTLPTSHCLRLEVLSTVIAAFASTLSQHNVNAICEKEGKRNDT